MTIRCNSLQADLTSDLTCKARLVWLDKYDNKKRSTLNAYAAFNEKSRYQDYLPCRKCTHGRTNGTR
jgi:hypothetical protein